MAVSRFQRLSTAAYQSPGTMLLERTICESARCTKSTQLEAWNNIDIIYNIKGTLTFLRVLETNKI